MPAVATSSGFQWHWVPWIIVGILVVVILAMDWFARESGMFEERGLGAAIVATNHTGTTITFRLFASGEWVELPRTLTPGQTDTVLSGASLFEPSTLTVDGCTEGNLVAIAQDGSEVARHPPPLCDGDRWVVTED
jgi:hypothetical protein